MKKRALSLLMAVIMVVSLLPTAVWAADGTLSGSGTEADPYLIASADDLKAFRDKVNAGDNSTLCAKLTQNIDLGNNSWTPIISSSATYITAYKGTFDGDYHTINGLKIDSTASNQGLFGAINGATIKNLKVNGSVTSSNNYIGGIVGKVQQGTIENCSFSGTVSTTKSGGYAGGITSYAGNTSTQKATITGCANTASVKGGVTGGIAGYVKYTTIENCYNVGTITRMGSGSSDRTGGIVGQSMNRSSVSHCYNSGTISSTSSFGAICGWNGGKTVTNCFWTQPETGKGAGNSDINEGKVDSISASDLGDAFTTDASGNVILAWESSGADVPKDPKILIKGDSALSMSNDGSVPTTTLTVEYKDMDDKPTVSWTTDSDIISLTAPENAEENNAAVIVTANAPRQGHCHGHSWRVHRPFYCQCCSLCHHSLHRQQDPARRSGR